MLFKVLRRVFALSENRKLVNDFLLKTYIQKFLLFLGLVQITPMKLFRSLTFDLSHFDAIMSVCPYYSNPTQSGIIKHFEKVSGHSRKPIMLLMFQVELESTWQMKQLFIWVNHVKILLESKKLGIPSKSII